jgi:plasmid maintenance system antidote protein VapI
MPMFKPPHADGTLKEALKRIPGSVTAFARNICASRVMLSRVLNKRAGFTPEIPLKVSEALGQDVQASGSGCGTPMTYGRPRTRRGGRRFLS